MDKEQLYELEAQYDSIAERRERGMDHIMTHIKTLRWEAKQRNEPSPFEAVTFRTKTFRSAFEKCEQKGIEPSVEAFEDMHDIAGIRIIVPFLDDIDRVVDALVRRKNLEVVEDRDYVKNPKKSGYRSRHLIVRTKVPFEYNDEWILVEIQIRTILQNTWSSLEHKLRYKNQDPAPETASEFAEIAALFFEKEKLMMHLRDFNKIVGVVGDENDEALESTCEEIAIPRLKSPTKLR